MNVAPFCPQSAATTTVSATAASSSTALNALATNAAVLRIVNAGPNTVFLVIGTGTQTAAVATSFPMLSGTVELFSKPIGADNIGAICGGSGTATVYVTAGEGL